MQQLTIGYGPAGTLLVAGDPDNPIPSVIQNTDPVNILYLGRDSSVNPSVPASCAPLYPGQTSIASGDINVFGIADRNKPVAVTVVNGVMSFFQPVDLTGKGNSYAQTTPPTQPPTIPPNSIWYNTTPGNQSFNTWTGTAWVPMTVPAGNMIQALTISSGLLVTGIVVAGIVDATNVKAAQYICTGSQGEFLAYSGVPAAGNLVNAIAGSSGNDGLPSGGNNFPAGLFGQGLTLVDQTVSPPAFPASSILYCINGRLRLRGSTTVDMVVDRSAVNSNNFSMSTQTLPTLLSGALNYIANEAAQASEFEIEVDGTFTTPATTTATFTFDLFTDGAAFGAGTSVTVGSVVTQTSKTYAFCVRFRVYLNGTGVSAPITISCDGGINIKGANAGNTSTFACLQNTATGFTWNTTVNHTLAIYCNWSSTTGTGHSAITYRTKIVRRN